MRRYSNLQTITRRWQVLIGLLCFWLALVFALGIWWGKVIQSQSQEIAGLRSVLGEVRPEDLERTARMLRWEQGTFLTIWVLVSGILIWLHWIFLKRSRSLQAFFASMTHELRTPLTSIRLQAETLAESLERFPSEEHNKQARLLSRLLTDTSRLESQVDRALELSRLEGGGELLLEPIEVQAFISRAIPALSVGLGKLPPIDLEISPGSIQADPAALHVILRNVVENSLKHANSKGLLHIKIMGQRIGHRFELQIQDNGIPSPSLQPAALGTLFARGSRSQGTGVGLYLVRTLTQHMNGTCDFEFGAAPSTGFNIRLTFPLLEDEATIP